mmetsp:Transcript_36909/g.115573  ORF Transcript_36909/g.115573 Transcript_36909/m.115573 type:complete len:476 (-) Transcript_36909:3320-4747(-)
MSTEIAESRLGSRMRHRKILRRSTSSGSMSGRISGKVASTWARGGSWRRGVTRAEDAKSDETSRCAGLSSAALAPLMSSSHPLELQGGEALVPPRPAGKKSMAKEEKSWMDLEAADAAKQRSSSQAHDSHISELEATRAEKFSEFIAEIKTSDRISMGLDRRGNLSKDEATVLLGAVQTRFNKVNRRSERLLHNMQHMNMVKEQDNRLRASSIRKNLLVRTFRPELMNVSKLQPSWNRSNDLPPRPFDGSKSLPLKQPKSVKEGSKSPLRRARSVKKELQVSRAERLDEDRDSPPREAHADRSLNLLELPGEIILLNSDVSEVLANKKKEMSDKRKSINLRARRVRLLSQLSPSSSQLKVTADGRYASSTCFTSRESLEAERKRQQGQGGGLGGMPAGADGGWDAADRDERASAGRRRDEEALMGQQDASWEYNMRHCIQHERWSFEGFCGESAGLLLLCFLCAEFQLEGVKRSW